MVAKCVKIISHISGAEKISSNWLTIGREYSVIAIFRDAKTVLLRLELDDGGIPGLQDAKQFVVIDNRLPSNWVVNLTQDYLELCPESWTRPGFWEEFFDGNEAARIEFRKEVAVLAKDGAQ